MPDKIASMYVALGLDKARFDSGIKSVQTSVSSFAASMGKLGKSMTLKVTLPVIAAGAAFGKMAADVVESENLFEVSMGDMADSARAWSKDISKALGLNQYEVRRMAATFNVMAGSMGLSNEAAYDMSQGLTRLAYDISSFYNLRPDEAFIKLQAAISGESEPLKRLGILVNETTIKQWALDKGIIKTGEDLSEAAKVVARYGTILEQTSKAQGDLARTADSTSNMIKRNQARFEELSATIGMQFLPIADQALSWVSNVGLPAMSAAIEAAKKGWAELSETGQRALIGLGLLLVGGGPVMMALSGLVRALGVVVAAAKFVGVAFKAVFATGLGMAVGKGIGILALFAGALGVIHTAVGAVLIVLLNMAKTGTDAIANLAWAAASVSDALGQKGLAVSLREAGNSAVRLGQQVETMRRQVTDRFTRWIDQLSGLAGQAGDAVGDTIDVLGDFGTAAKVASDVYAQAFSAATTATGALREEFLKYKELDLAMYLRGIGDAAKGVGSAMKQAAKDAGMSLQEMAQVFAEMHPAVRLLDLRLVGLGDQLAAVNAAISANAAAQQEMQKAISRTQDRISELNNRLSDAKQRLADLTSPRLTGMGALDDQIFETEQAIKRLQLVAAGGVLPKGMAVPKESMAELQKLLERLRLQREVSYEPLLRKLQMAAQPPEAEISFADAIKQIAATKSEIASLEGQLTSANAVLAAQQAQLEALKDAQYGLQEAAAGLQTQMQQANELRQMMIEKIMAAILWSSQQREEMIKSGKITVEQAKLLDEKTTEMLKLFFDFSDEHSETSLHDIQTVVGEWESAYTRIRTIASGIRSEAGSIGPVTIPVIGSRQSGGPIHQTGAYILHRGEHVIPATGGGLGQTTIHVHIAGSVVTEHDLMASIKRGLLLDGNRNVTTGIT